MHAVVGGLTSGIDGALGAGAATVTAPLIDAQIDKLDLPDALKQTVLAASTTTLGAALGGTAGAGAALTETANNYLTSKQEVERDKALAACKTLACTAGTNLKYLLISTKQNAALVVGVGGGMGLQNVEQASALVDMVVNLPETLTALKAIVNDPQVREQVSAAVIADYQQRIDMLTRAYNDGGFDGSVTAGVEAGRLAVDIVALGTAAAGATKVVAITAKAGAGLIVGDVANVAAGAAASAARPGPAVNAAMLDELAANGVKFTPKNVVATGRSASGQVVFLEKGNAKSGLNHIIEEHGGQFAQIGVSEAEIPSVVMKAVVEGKIVGYQGSGTGRPIYEITINGQPQRVAVTVGSNGYIVGANPRGFGK